MGRLTVPRNRLTDVDSVRAEWLCQVQLDGEEERGTAGGNRTRKGVLKMTPGSQFDQFVWNDL